MIFLKCLSRILSSVALLFITLETFVLGEGGAPSVNLNPDFDTSWWKGRSTLIISC